MGTWVRPEPAPPRLLRAARHEGSRIPGSPAPPSLLLSFPSWDFLRGRGASGPALPVVGGWAPGFLWKSPLSQSLSLSLPLSGGRGLGQVRGI